MTSCSLEDRKIKLRIGHDRTVTGREAEQVEAYTSFAAVYDTFMDNVPYEEWGEYIHGMLCKYGVEDGLYWIWDAAREQ